MTILTKAEIGRAVTALRDLTDIIERLEKSTWPLSSQDDVLRKADGLHPRPSRSDDASAKALAALDDAAKRLDCLDAQTARKTWTIA
jgi:hypothetical protein